MSIELDRFTIALLILRPDASGSTATASVRVSRRPAPRRLVWCNRSGRLRRPRSADFTHGCIIGGVVRHFNLRRLRVAALSDS
jgi:hypothetical protein